MSDRLLSLRVDNFRSIRGTHELTLDANIVLVTGANGAGKTSLMSAIEWAATGKIEHLTADARAARVRGLLHHGQPSGLVELIATDQASGQASGRMVLGPSSANGQPLLKGRQALEFGERNMLSQATMSRLLDLYVQKTESGGEPPLVRFVRELLRLDTLDALIGGLEKSSHVAQARRLSTQWSRAESRAPQALREARAAHDTLQTCRTNMSRWLSDAQHLVGLPEGDPDDVLKRLQKIARTEDREGDEAHVLTTAKIELEVFLSSVQRNTPDVNRTAGRTAAAESVAEIELELEQLWKTEGATTRAALAAVAQSIDVQFNAKSDDIGSLYEEVAREVDEQLRAARANYTRIDELNKLRATHAAEAAESQAELERLDTLANNLDLPDELQEFAEALGGIRQHVRDATCPVCDREFIGEPGVGLLGHIAAKIDRLSKAAQEAASLATLRAQEARRRDAALAAELDAAARGSGRGTLEEAASAVTRLSDAGTALARCEDVVRRWETLSARRLTAVKDNARWEQLNSELALVLRDARSLAMRLGEDVAGLEHNPAEILSAMKRRVTDRLRASEASAKARSGASSLLERYAQASDELALATKRAEEANAVSASLQAGIAEAERRKKRASTLRLDAESLRSSRINEVFTQQLNSTWRDIFSRLAPDEPFTPQFKPGLAKNRRIEVSLTTLHRDGSEGPSPRETLSFGNANTAALSLFSALHFSAPVGRPWLLFDDPVQSMDDLHVANFAALLRRMAYDLNRQIVVAVHERALFEYLSLQLRPTRHGQQLLTHELTRGAGKTRVDSIRYDTPLSDGLESSRAA